MLWLGGDTPFDETGGIMHLATTCLLPPPTLRRIPAEALWACPLVAPIAVVDGRAWITQAGDPRDHVVDSGGQWQPTGSGRVVIQALGGPLAVRIGVG